MRAHTKFLVNKILKGRAINTAAEIGVFKGDNAFGLLHELDIELLVGVDPYIRYPEFDNNLSNKKGVVARADLELVKKQMLSRMEIFGSRFELMEGFSVEAAAQFDDETFDFIFIDGNHYYNYVYEDIFNWFPKLKKGGIISGHDYINKPNYGVIQAVDDLLPDSSFALGAKVWWYDKPLT